MSFLVVAALISDRNVYVFLIYLDD
jgi:hypothetical protein